MDEMQATTDAAGFATTPTNLIFQANSAQLRGDSASALAFERQAATQLLRERSAYFDPLRRGALVEGNVSLPRALALRLIQRGARAEAFDLLESFRGRGIGEMTAILARPGVTSSDRAWLAGLTRAEAQLGAAQNKLVERALATEGERPATADINELADARRDREKLLADAIRRQRFEKSGFEQVRLDELKAIVAKEHVPVVLYWTTRAQLIAWLITPEPVAVPSVGKPGGLAPPDQVNVRSIFLTEPLLREYVRRVRNSASSEGVPLDEDAARRLYLFLIAPFEKALGTGPVMIVPQGALTELPFEILIDSDGRYFAERHITSYAPSATLARAALARPSKIPLKIAAIQDETIASEEIDRIRAVVGSGLTVTPAYGTGLSQLIKLAADAPVLHVLAHGEFDYDDPLLSPLKLGSPVLAADLLAVPLGKTRLVVLSACEIGTQARRVSNELFGFPWALQAAGAHNAIVSRWAVPSEANAAWMPDFYAALGKGESPASAAAAASRAMIARGQRQPHDWAAMQVIGR
jgi:CHAT domain-containing protein